VDARADCSPGTGMFFRAEIEKLLEGQTGIQPLAVMTIQDLENIEGSIASGEFSLATFPSDYVSEISNVDPLCSFTTSLRIRNTAPRCVQVLWCSKNRSRALIAQGSSCFRNRMASRSIPRKGGYRWYRRRPECWRILVSIPQTCADPFQCPRSTGAPRSKRQY
jgi:hypothetical protein